VLALVLPTGATGDLIAAIAGADVAVPLAAVALDQAESVRLLRRTDGSSRAGTIPCYAHPEAAASALARVAAYGAWRARPYGQLPALDGLHGDDARQVIRAFLGRLPDGGWLSPEESARLLGCYGIPLAALQPVASEEAAARTAAMFDGPAVLKVQANTRSSKAALSRKPPPDGCTGNSRPDARLRRSSRLSPSSSANLTARSYSSRDRQRLISS
jgi:acyl-CoA synthetase (NDP forming)